MPILQPVTGWGRWSSCRLQGFFQPGYNSLRGEIAALHRQVETSLSDRAIADLERTIDQNAAAIEFWARFCEIVPPALAGVVGDTLRTLRQATLGLLDRKAAAPLERVNIDAASIDAQAVFVSLQQTVTAYNRSVPAANAIIAAKKKATGAANIKTVE